MVPNLKLIRIPKMITPISLFGIAVLFLLFRWAPHLWLVDKLLRTNSLTWWQNFQLDSDELVIARVQENIGNGITSHIGALGVGGTYNSQFGLLSWINSILVTIVPVNTSQKISLLYSLTALANAILVAIVLRTIRQHLGNAPTTAALFILLQPWPTAMFHSIYWAIWIKFLPAIALVVLVKLKVSRFGILLVFTFSTIFSLLSGYEYITLTFFSIISVTFLMRDLLDNDTKSQVKFVFQISIAFACSFLFTLLIHFIQLIGIFKNVTSAQNFLLATINKRTGTSIYNVGQIYFESLKSAPLSVLDEYLNVPVIGSPSRLPIVGLFNMYSLMLMCAVACISALGLRASSQEIRNIVKIMQVWLVGMLGPLGWILLARPHSFIHTHINFALWYIFSAPIATALLVKSLIIIKTKIAYPSGLKWVFGLFILFFAIFFLYSQITVIK